MAVPGFLARRRLRIGLAVWFLLSNLFLSFWDNAPVAAVEAVSFNVSPSNTNAVSVNNAPAPIAPADFFGMVGRDPWYDFNTDPTNPGKPNKAFQESMSQQMSMVGARWIRLEFHADARPGAKGGFIDYQKYDSFINEVAPRYNLKVLALLGADIVIAKNPDDYELAYNRLNDAPDQSDGSNPYIRAFVDRVKEISDHYGDKIAAFEILNEANNWYGFRAKAENVGILTGLTYARVKPTRPATKFLLGATIATGDPRLDHVSYLQGIYNSEAIKSYKENGYHYEDNLYPFDGVAWHPYFTNAFDSIYTVDQAIGVMRKAGDNLNKLWVTETGLEGTKDNNNCIGATPGKEDVAQGEYLYIFYSQAAQRQKDIAAVFWFKFEDFYDNGQLKALGMVHLAINKNGYAPHGGKIVRYKPAYSAYQRLAVPILPIAKVEQPARSSSSGDQNYYFAQTGHSLSGTFLNYWLKNGGPDLFGLPLTEPYKEVDPGNGKSYLVQWFERERFELHPENAGTKYEVLLGLLGSELIARSCRSFSRAQPLPPPPPPEKGKPPLPERSYFNATGHNLVGSFKEYWERRGGLAVFGYPISEEFGENSPTDGKFYVVQYFERARFELHPEARGTPYEVQLGLLGSQALVARAWK